jgi:regulator of replication initiation timing
MTGPDPVAALAEQLEQLRGQLARTQGELGAVRERLEGETSQTAMLRLDVKHQKERLDKAIAAQQLKPPPAPWWEFGSDEARAMMAELHEWVEAWLRPNFADYLTRLPSCWPRHGAAAWELATLRTEWVRIYVAGEEEDRDLQGALAWLDRFLPNTLARLHEAIKCDDIRGCQLPQRRHA